jgi:histidinol-phosphate/aromatic aminotransferase/cobyric acid decarboxylase-like protein
VKKWVLFFLLIITMSVFAGCSKVEPQKSKVEPQKELTIQFKRFSINEAPLKVQEWAEPIIAQQNRTWMHFEDKTYLIVARGEKRTGGYKVKIEKVVASVGDTEVTYTITDPEPGQIVTQVITYPYDLGWIPKTNLSIRFAGPDL